MATRTSTATCRDDGADGRAREAGGMASEEVEQLITFPMETAMNGLPGVESVRSVSSAGLSSMEEGLPPEVAPRMGPISSVMGKIMQVAIPIDTAKIFPLQVREHADWVLRPRLMAIPGVAQVISIGGEVRQFQMQPKTARMARLGITREQLADALKKITEISSHPWILALTSEKLRMLEKLAGMQTLLMPAITQADILRFWT